jgi:hypothetical protein
VAVDFPLGFRICQELRVRCPGGLFVERGHMSSSSASMPFSKYEYHIEDKRDASLIVDKDADIKVLANILTCDIPLYYSINLLLKLHFLS